VGRGGDAVAAAVGHHEPAGAALAVAVLETFDPAAAGDRHVGLVEIVDHRADGNAADLLGPSADRVEPEALGIPAADQQHHFASALVVAGAA